MNTVYLFPKAAAFGKTLTKNKIYEHARAGTKVKKLFVQEVDKVVWAYKLSPDTINIPATPKVQEIQVFDLYLKDGELSEEVLQTIDKAIPSPILFVLRHNNTIQYNATFKRPSEADKGKWVISTYFSSSWLEEPSKSNSSGTDVAVKELPVVLNMEALYTELLKELIPLSSRKGETLPALVERVDTLRLLEREALKTENKMLKEKQFKKKVELNRTLNQLKSELEVLTK